MVLYFGQMPEQTSNKGYEDQDLLEDLGFAYVLESHPELIDHTELPEEPTRLFAADAVTVSV